jgi:PAS domain S-box-containing protein
MGSASTTGMPVSVSTVVHHFDMAAAATDLAAELLEMPAGAPPAIRRALERFRLRAYASSVAFWVVTERRAERTITVSEAVSEAAGSTIEVADATSAIERLRHNGTILCRAGEVSGVEVLVPAGVLSFVAAASSRGTRASGVLVIGWTDPTPPCNEPVPGHLQIAAALLTKAFRPHPLQGDRSTLQDVILGSLPDRIAVVDRQGIIIAVNAAWMRFSEERGITSGESVGLGASYFDGCRRAADDGSHEAAAALEGVKAVCSGMSELFEMSDSFGVADAERSYLMTVTPLRRAEGGAVIAYSEVTPPKVTELARRLSEDLFHRLADTVPVPIWMVDVDGRLIYGNQAWAEATGSRSSGPHRLAIWAEVIHPDDRAMAAAAFRSAAARRARFDIELRLHADGTYRWWSFVGAPTYGADGTLERYLGSCADATTKRHAQQALHELGSKLVAIQEDERSRIARELHDDLGQQVALLLSKLETAAHDRQVSRNRVMIGLSEARNGLQELASAIHNLSHQLHPAKLRLLGLEQTLTGLCRDVSSESGVHVRFHADGVPSDVAEPVALCIFRVTQESLQNAVKHSGARIIDVLLTGTAAQLTLRVADNGTGFEPLPSQSAGIGLLTMRERVELIGGRLKIETAPGRGTAIEATVALGEARPPARV